MVMAGSPKKFQVRRTSGSRIPALAVMIAAPIDCVGFAASVLSKAWFNEACGGAVVKPEEAQTPTAPPFGANSSADDRLSSYTSWKNPFRQSMIKNTGKRLPLVSAVADVLSSKSVKAHCCSEP